MRTPDCPGNTEMSLVALGRIGPLGSAALLKTDPIPGGGVKSP